MKTKQLNLYNCFKVRGKKKLLIDISEYQGVQIKEEGGLSVKLLKTE